MIARNGSALVGEFITHIDTIPTAATNAFVGSARGEAAQHERVNEAALARALVAEQHHLDDVAQCRPLGQIS